MTRLCACIEPRLVEDGTCSLCGLRCLGNTTPDQDRELIETLWLIATGQRKPFLQKNKEAA